MATITLTDGRTVVLRPATASDAPALERLFYRLSRDSVMLWLCAGVPQTPHFAHILARYAEVDGRDAVALVAEEAGQVVGIARYVRVAPPVEAEIALVIEDSWQGRHMGRAMLRQLVAYARTQGLSAFLGDCLAENHRVLRMLAAVFPERRATVQGGMYHLRLPLAAAR
jgi:RimJ/RimL family protein N-acetyltransferase